MGIACRMPSGFAGQETLLLSIAGDGMPSKVSDCLLPGCVCRGTRSRFDPYQAGEWLKFLLWQS